MKRALLFLITFLYIIFIYGQNVPYTHDSAGNRIKRGGALTFDWSRADISPLVSRSVLPITYQSDAPDPYRSLNTTLQVGRTEGNASVSDLGAAIYQIPIKVVDGTNGMQPQLSVGYNSQSGNGIMGYGWGLSASSYIMRVGKNYYYDGAADEIKLTTADNLMLDGQRLIRTSGTNMVVGSVYACEKEDYSIVEYVTINSKDAFRVRTKDGMVYEYGINTDSNIRAQNASCALYWLLSKVTDRYGNYMLYHYNVNATTGEFYLSSIEYTGNTNENVSPYNKVEFSYDDRNDTMESYVAGNVITQKKLLVSIKCLSDGVVIKEYKFKYLFDQYYSKLSEVEEYGRNGARYNSTIVDWGDYDGNNSKYAQEYFSGVDVSREGIYPDFLDFDGDGKADMMTYPTKSSYSSSDNAVLYQAYSPYGDVSFSKKCTLPLCSDFQALRYADLNGDGKMDVIRIQKVGKNNYRFDFYLFNGSSFVESGGFNNSDSRILTGDFNADGKTEVLTRNAKVYNQSATEIASGGIDNWGTDYVSSYPNNNYLVDFNGDGKTDVLTMSGSACWVYTLNGGTFTKLTSFSNSELRNWNFNYFGDFNGDGKTDVLCQSSSNFSTVTLFLSTGKTFIKKQIVNHDIKAKVLVGDFNRDGRHDILHLEPITGNKLKIKIGTFNGTNFDNEYYTTSLMTNGLINDDTQTGQSNLAVADFDGDGRSEFIMGAYADMNLLYQFNDKMNLHVKSIVDGYNSRVSFDYMPITQGAYTETADAVTFPVVKMKAPLYVVYSQNLNADGYYQNFSYKYKDLCVHRQGKGILCFKNISVTNNSRNIEVISDYNIDEDYYFSYMYQQIKQKTDRTEVSLMFFANKILPGTGKRYELQPFVKIEQDHLKNTFINTVYKDYEYGSPKFIGIMWGNDIIEEKTIEYKNVFGNQRMLGLPLNVTIKKQRTGESDWIEKVVNTYDNNNRLTNKVSYTKDGMKKVSEEIYGYDSFGHMVSKSVKSYSSSDAVTTTYNYSSNGQHLVEEISPFGLKSGFSYTRGLLTSSTDIRNNNTTYEYDDMGNLVKVIYPDNIVRNITLGWNQSVPQSLYYVQVTQTNAPTVVSYYNAFGEVVRKGETQFNGTMIYEDHVYDSKDMLQKKSMPFTGSSASLWNTYSYDSFDRPTQIMFASGNQQTYSYSGTSVTETKDGISTTRDYDPQGNLLTVTDSNGTITYSYLANGNVESVKVSNDISTSFTYDDWGRKTSINDPAAGIKTFGYDQYGNVNRMTDANNKTVSYVYDKYGKLLSETTPEFSVTYSYDPHYPVITAVSNTNGTSATYTYDKYGNVLTDKQVGMDGKWLQKTYSYVNGILTATGYQSQAEVIGTENYTYANGHLKTIKLGTNTIWDLQSADNFGNPTKIVTGTVTRNYTYNQYGVPTGRSSLSSSGGTIQNSTYAFDLGKGNLSSRKDNTRNLTENFTYDAVNRLTGYKGATVSYDAISNITNKTDAGIMQYDKYRISNIAPVSSVSTAQAKPQSVTYTSFMRPGTISENGYQATFSYNADYDRVKMQITKNGSNYLTRHYLGNVYEIDEKVGSSKEKLYLGGGYYHSPAVYVKENGVWRLNYICRDYLGNITHITDNSGKLLAEYSYDAWGRMRNPVNQNVYLPGSEPDLLLGRGYTGHEHLSVFGLINMNARLYDPVLGRFLSPDPFVQLPDNLRSLNRYGYGMCNPLCYVDENGEFWWIVAAAVIGGVVNAAIHSDQINSVGSFFGYFGVGAAAGALGAVTGGAIAGAVGGLSGVAGGAIIGAGSGAASGAVFGAGNAAMAGGNFGDILSGGLSGAASGALSGAVTGGAFGGAVSYFKGQNVWTGADVAAGRSQFSFKNTPVAGGVKAPKVAVEPDVMPKATEPSKPVGNATNEYSITTNDKISTPVMEGEKSLSLRPLKIEGYNSRLDLQGDLYHTYPRSFDKQILEHGDIFGIRGNSQMMVAPGTINGVEGVYTLGINSNTGIVYHRAFYDWDSFMKTFKFPFIP
ncbi:FG-GAP-like repeat-containing protein [Phocaeicola sartorii]|uniref:FG-GAP-like repeat-containing protein n=1 Tax=Phocaeicola sartorii TaxID=671267 RepID=UPI002608AB83|nr:FG-GAP-like repeat-containing protein [Phocaeicola sartorii]